MPKLKLTDEQASAAGSSERRLFIEAHPGSGKTTVAGERFGAVRFGRRDTAKSSVAAVSFTRSATGELERRITYRWGTTAVAWPSRITTIDSLIIDLTTHLLRTETIHWPSGHLSLVVLDNWRGHRGYRWLANGGFRRAATIDDAGMVTSLALRVREPQGAIGNRGDFEKLLAEGLCAHEDLRLILSHALDRPHMRRIVMDFLATFDHLVVDEAFDANGLDLRLVRLACDAGVQSTLVGDPWQALYGFRGARPDLMNQLIQDLKFVVVPLSQSFRFRTEQTRSLATALRASEPVDLTPISGPEVVLAPTWDDVWSAGSAVLPLSFGRLNNQTDAATIVLLDQLTYRAFGRRAVFLDEALVLLGLPRERYLREGGTWLGGVVALLGRQTDQAPRLALDALRDAVRQVTGRRPRALATGPEERQLMRLRALAQRASGDVNLLVPGMTIHQAKGCEWDRVGVRLSASHVARLRAGLSDSDETARSLYVALTRARREIGLVA
ncbi:MAG: UvrD-helicase domain-containing protein [Dehalococcoidia bacterium]|nr:UvrD-helicase domain-containing protein [Dehalococcoidia bacterium]